MFDMEKRSYERIEAVQLVRISCRNKIYTGATLNLSEKGIFVDIKRGFSTNIMCSIYIYIDDQLLKMLARVKHFTRINGSCYGVGIEVINSPKNYLEYMKNLKKTSEVLL